jgi:hypothetical protein
MRRAAYGGPASMCAELIDRSAFSKWPAYYLDSTSHHRYNLPQKVVHLSPVTWFETLIEQTSLANPLWHVILTRPHPYISGLSNVTISILAFNHLYIPRSLDHWMSTIRTLRLPSKLKRCRRHRPQPQLSLNARALMVCQTQPAPRGRSELQPLMKFAREEAHVHLGHLSSTRMLSRGVASSPTDMLTPTCGTMRKIT